MTDLSTGGELTPGARAEIARYRVDHVSAELAHTPLAVRLYLDPILFERVNKLAEMMAASGSMPEHLRGDVAACLNCIDRSIAWGLSPWSVAQGQFTVRKGATPGYFGRLIIAAVNNSPRMDGGGMTFEHFADGNASWDNVLGKFETRPSTRNKDSEGNPTKYQVATYTDKDEVGLGVLVRCKLKGEAEPREMKVYLRQCQPRNSVLWATDPMTQIIYTASRRFANAYCPDILLGVRTEEDFGPEERDEMKDITPTPTAATRRAAMEAAEPVDPDTGEVTAAAPKSFSFFEAEVGDRTYRQPKRAADALIEIIEKTGDPEQVLARYDIVLEVLPQDHLKRIHATVAERKSQLEKLSTGEPPLPLDLPLFPAPANGAVKERAEAIASAMQAAPNLEALKTLYRRRLDEIGAMPEKYRTRMAEIYDAELQECRATGSASKSTLQQHDHPMAELDDLDGLPVEGA